MALTPALATRISARDPRRRRKMPSAMGLRQTLPVQTKSTVLGAGWSAMERTRNLHSNKGVIKPACGKGEGRGNRDAEATNNRWRAGRTRSFNLVKRLRRF